MRELASSDGWSLAGATSNAWVAFGPFCGWVIADGGGGLRPLLAVEMGGSDFTPPSLASAGDLDGDGRVELLVGVDDPGEALLYTGASLLDLAGGF